jgi:hypothetical protein
VVTALEHRCPTCHTQPVSNWLIPAIALIPFALGYATMRIADSQGCPPGEKTLWFLFGFFLPVFGLVTAALVAGRSSKPPPAPRLPDPP